MKRLSWRIDRDWGGDEDSSLTGQIQNDREATRLEGNPDPMANSVVRYRRRRSDRLRRLPLPPRVRRRQASHHRCRTSRSPWPHHARAATGAAYLGELESGEFDPREPEVVTDRGAAVTWDGGGCPASGWPPARWISRWNAAPRTASQPWSFATATTSVCLGIFSGRAAIAAPITIASSDPAVASVAPFGGRRQY